MNEVTDSVMNLIQEESADKHIPIKIVKKNLIYFRMLFNPQFKTQERLNVANYIIELFKNQEDAFLEHLKSDALKIFTSDIFSSVKLAPLSVILSKLVEDFINGKILEFDAVAGVMGKSLNAYMYLMEDRELKWDDFHSLQEAKLAKYENSMMWNEHLVGCHTAIGRLL